MAGLDLGKMVGPLPLGAWLAVGGTGIGVAMWARGSGSGTITEEPGAMDDEYDWSSVGTGASGQWIDVTPPEPVGAKPPTDNDEWGRLAIAFLISDGYDSGLAQTAIGKALQERRLSVREYALWWIALRELGAPPYAVVVKVPAGFDNKPPEPKDPPKPGWTGDGHRWYITRPGESLKRIARRAYGDESKWHRIYEANRKGVKRPNGSHGWIEHPRKPLPGGRRLFIPRG